MKVVPRRRIRARRMQMMTMQTNKNSTSKKAKAISTRIKKSESVRSSMVPVASPGYLNQQQLTTTIAYLARIK
jgi:hypothetical protein